MMRTLLVWTLGRSPFVSTSLTDHRVQFTLLLYHLVYVPTYMMALRLVTVTLQRTLSNATPYILAWSRIGSNQMNDVQLQLQLSRYTIQSSFSGRPSPEDSSLSPHTFRPQPCFFPSAHWYTSTHLMKTCAQGLIHFLITAPSLLTTAVLLALLLAGFTLMALLAYSSPLPSPASLYNDPTMGSGDNSSAPVISNSSHS